MDVGLLFFKLLLFPQEGRGTPPGFKRSDGQVEGTQTNTDF